jgi:hypothetical protein
LEQQKPSSNRKAWGTGRVAVRAHLPTIQKMLADGHPLTVVYQHIKDSLAGLSYNAFTYQTRKHFQDTKQKTPSFETLSATNESPKTEPPPKQAANLFPNYQPGPKEPDIKELF